MLDPFNMFASRRSILLFVAFVGCIELLATLRSIGQTDQTDPTPTPQPSGTPIADVSSNVLGFRVQQLETEIENLKDQPARFASWKVKLADAETKIQSVNPESELPTRVDAIKTAFQNLSTHSAAEDVASLVGEFKDAVDRLEDIRSEITDPVGEIYQSLAFPFNGLTNTLSIAANLKKQALTRFDDAKVTALLPHFSELVNKIQSDHINFQSLPFAGVADEIRDRLLTTYTTELDAMKTRAIQALKTADSDLGNELLRLEQKQKDDDKEIISINKELRSREQTQASLVSGNLIWIFIGIVVTIIVVLLILRVNSDEQSLLMIRERTAFELFATGMFLVTVIVLATGNLVEKTVLGTLLGTLAGYLFTRRGSSAPTTSDQKAAARRRPKKPSFEPTDGKLRLPRLDNDTDFYEIYARDATKPSSSPTLMGLSSEQEFEIPASVKRAVTYQVWIIGKSLEGDSPPSESILVKL